MHIHIPPYSRAMEYARQCRQTDNPVLYLYYRIVFIALEWEQRAVRDSQDHALHEMRSLLPSFSDLVGVYIFALQFYAQTGHPGENEVYTVEQLIAEVGYEYVENLTWLLFRPKHYVLEYVREMVNEHLV